MNAMRMRGSKEANRPVSVLMAPWRNAARVSKGQSRAIDALVGTTGGRGVCDHGVTSAAKPQLTRGGLALDGTSSHTSADDDVYRLVRCCRTKSAPVRATAATVSHHVHELGRLFASSKASATPDSRIRPPRDRSLLRAMEQS